MNHLPLKHFDGDTIPLTDSHLLQHSVIGNNHLSGHQSDQNPVTNPNLHTTRHFLQHNVLAPRRHQSDPGQYLNRGPSIMSDQMLRVPQTNVEFVPQHRRAKSAATSNMFALSMSQNALSISERRSPEGRPSPNYKDIQLDENGNQVFASPTAVVGQVMRRPNTLGLHGAESMNRNGTNSRVPAFRRSLSDPIGFSMLSMGTHDDDIGHANLTTPDAGPAPNYPLTSVDEESDSDDDLYDTHPNKFPVAIEEHGRRECGYYRQKFRSGHQVKIIKRRDADHIYSPVASPSDDVQQAQQKKYYRKDLVRVCVCGKEIDMESMLHNRGRDNDTEGYEIHYNNKCKWKGYEDFKTKKRVLIRLCKCYKPSF